MSGQQRRVSQKRVRTKKEKTEEPSIHRRRPRAQSEAVPAHLDRVDERMSEILGERQTHQVISDTRLWEDNVQKGGQ